MILESCGEGCGTKTLGPDTRRHRRRVGTCICIFICIFLLIDINGYCNIHYLLYWFIHRFNHLIWFIMIFVIGFVMYFFVLWNIVFYFREPFLGTFPGKVTQQEPRIRSLR